MRRPIKLLGFGIMVAAMLVMASLTIAEYHYGTDPLMYVTLPGLICGLLITGGHGGTNFQEVAGEVVAVTVNMAIVAFPFTAVLHWIPKGLHNQTVPKQ